jgi:Kef-type K+ transport system membrane component KefB
MGNMPQLTSEVTYLALIFGLLVVPRALQRFLIPAPLTSFALGMVAALFVPLFAHDATLELLATLGISSLFLVAGLEVDLQAVRRGLWVVLGHLAVRSGMIALAAWLCARYLGVSWQAATLMALAVLTPSTGFILDTLGRLGLNDDERFWVTVKAIGGEVLALLVLFGVLQSSTSERLLWASGELLLMIVLLPLIFLVLARWVMPYAPESGFSMLVMVGLIAAYLTKQLGVYYLVGAFLAGFTARLLRERIPLLAPAENLRAVRLFASFFIPFYFFHGGMSVPAGALVWQSLWLGALLAALVLPLRIAVVWLQRRYLSHEDGFTALKVSTALVPTLIFTLVLATILHEQFALPDTWYGALLVYAAITTLLPTLVLSKPFELDVAAAAAPAAAVTEAGTVELPVPSGTSSGASRG